MGIKLSKDMIKKVKKIKREKMKRDRVGGEHSLWVLGYFFGVERNELNGWDESKCKRSDGFTVTKFFALAIENRAALFDSCNERAVN